jgi:hypothetical protein
MTASRRINYRNWKKWDFTKAVEWRDAYANPELLSVLGCFQIKGS